LLQRGVLALEPVKFGRGCSLLDVAQERESSIGCTTLGGPRSNEHNDALRGANAIDHSIDDMSLHG
jgi:hypothetical protein